MCRPSGAVTDRTTCPTVSTVGYVVMSLRDFEQHKGKTPHISSGRNFLQDRLLEEINVFHGVVPAIACPEFQIVDRDRCGDQRGA